MKVYLAGPFFNPEQIERISYLETTLLELGFELFSPRLDSLVGPNSTVDDLQKTFDANIAAINDCNFVLAVTDGKDVGTMFECGVSYILRKPIMYFAETLGERPFNLMLAQSADLGVCRSRENLEAKLEDLMINGIADSIVSIKYTGNIE